MFDSFYAIILLLKQQEREIFDVIFYENASGESELLSFLEELRVKARRSKDARIQYKQLTFYIELLQRSGNELPTDVAKHLKDGIWELRPGCNRVFYFFFSENTFVLLHHYRKRTQKTPPRELEKALAEKADFLARKEKVKK